MAEGNARPNSHQLGSIQQPMAQGSGRGIGNHTLGLEGGDPRGLHGETHRDRSQQTQASHEAIHGPPVGGVYSTIRQNSAFRPQVSESNQLSGQSERSGLGHYAWSNNEQLLYPQMPGASWMAGLENRRQIGSIDGFVTSPYMQHFQGNLSNRQLPETGTQTYGLVRPIPMAGLIQPDEIASRSIGPSSYQQQSHQRSLGKRQRSALARPCPPSPRPVIRRNRKCTRQIWIPLRHTGPLQVSAEGHECKMKKITHFIIPALKIELPSHTPWGGVYNGDAFLPNTGQFEIAQRCARMEKGKLEWQTMAGCFVLKTPKSHMRTEKRYMGGGSLKPMYLHATSTWKDLPSNLVYIPDPSTMMTKAQLQIYKLEVSFCETPEGQRPLHEGANVITIEDSDGSSHEPKEDIQCNESNSNVDGEEVTTRVVHDMDSDCEDTTYFQGGTFGGEDEEAREGGGVVTRMQTRSREESLNNRCIASTMEERPLTMRSDSSDHFFSQTRYNDRNLIANESSDTFQGRLSDIPRFFPYTTMSEQNALTTDLLMSKWTAADLTLINLQKAHEESKDAGLDLVVDLGDLTSQFWECFEACCLEDSDAAKSVFEDIQFLRRRREQHFGLTSTMVDQNVSRVLNSVLSMKPYLRFDVEFQFNKAAMPDWVLWEKLSVLNDGNTINMNSVVEDENWALNLFREAPTSFAKDEFTESQILAMRDRYMQWKDNNEAKNLSSSKTEVSGVLYDIVKAKKIAQQALDDLVVHQISFTGLLEFRRFHSQQAPYKLKVKEGKELQAVHEMLTEILKSKIIFPDFNVEYMSITSDASLLHETTTIDAGGLTDRCMGELWSYFFDGSWEYRTVFERPRDAEICHLNSHFLDTVHTHQDALLAGQILFLMILKKQRVTRPMTMATIAIALGKEPRREVIYEALANGDDNLYIEDYKSFKPTEFEVMARFMAGKRSTRKEDLEYILTSLPDYYLWFSKLSPNMEEDEFSTKVKRLIADVIFDTLFIKCSGISKVFREGFLSLVNTINTSSLVSSMDKKLVMSTTFKDVSVDSMTAFFSAERGITSKEFLSKVIYSCQFPEDLKSIFVKAVTLFTGPETYRLYNFVTDEKYNRGTPCTVMCNRSMSLDSLPEAHTCTKTLEIPYYKDMETLHKKLALATFSLAYGKI